MSHSSLQALVGEHTPQTTTNPLKLIARVLHYARKHKYPENRSALTYWEEEAPSRLDLGKEKYGGPFTEEEVEDVKTVFSTNTTYSYSVAYQLLVLMKHYHVRILMWGILQNSSFMTYLVTITEGIVLSFATSCHFLQPVYLLIFPCMDS